MDPEYPPRVFFNEFNDTALNLVVYYWYHPPEWWDYLAFTQKVNMQILERFNAEGIDFAFPTQTVHLANDAKRQLAVRMLGGEKA
jgi:MscS family membrane protein